MIHAATDGDVAVVTLDRPQRRNALTREGLAELGDAVDDASAPVLYLHGAGEAFCAGADLDVVDGLKTREAAEFAAAGQDVARALATYDGATVAGIDGAARGGGVELALACDVRVCTPDATLAESGVSLGLFGAWGGTARLPDVVGRGVAADLALSGRALDAEEARAVGLVSRVVEDPRTVAKEIAANDHDAVRAVAELLRNPADPTSQEERERQTFADLVGTRSDEDG
ncbi:Enoyl-CoA hydratase/carnithine racemase [Halomicrobium zhouii]|uniref:Enoyl-CoA hydratase/carnithine racemase n=1 Tax=Halomicrobium zhouii TaxID=767519 RepID=A0A1I6M7D2_9EURY|nr:Enoyl-CoA hydratase/carnithine racemase [Halomicrobium zhouii]